MESPLRPVYAVVYYYRMSTIFVWNWPLAGNRGDSSYPWWPAAENDNDNGGPWGSRRYNFVAPRVRLAGVAQMRSNAEVMPVRTPARLNTEIYR